MFRALNNVLLERRIKRHKNRREPPDAHQERAVFRIHRVFACREQGLLIYHVGLERRRTGQLQKRLDESGELQECSSNSVGESSKNRTFNFGSGSISLPAASKHI